MIPSSIKIKNNELPDSPGVYFYYDEKGELLYIGKATSLKRRVGSYFTKAHDNRIAELVSRIAKIHYIETPTVIEALVLEANQIKANKPPYNIMQRDDKSFLYLVITNEEFPRPMFMRGLELENMGIDPFDREMSAKAKNKFIAIYGPYTSGTSLRKALEYIRRIIPWTQCQPPTVTGKTRPCFYRHIRKCPGVCTGEIDRKTYRRVIRDLMYFFEGKKKKLVERLEKEMRAAAKAHQFERAADFRNKAHALQHIQDVAFIMKEDVELPFSNTKPDLVIDLKGRIEAYDISTISGTSGVGAMTVFEDEQPAKSQYRKFRIKTVEGNDDVGMMEEMIRRRVKRGKQYPNAWPFPEIFVIDGGEGHVNRVERVLEDEGVDVPVVGIAKGFDRKQDRLVFDRADTELARAITMGKEIFQKARDEAHHFAGKYHRVVRSRTSGTLGLKQKKKNTR